MPENATISFGKKVFWYRSQFACQICYSVVQSTKMLENHVQGEHKMNGAYYSDHFKAEPLVKVTHGCLICGKEVLFDSQLLADHLSDCHNMTDAEYKLVYHNKYSLPTSSSGTENDWAFKCFYKCGDCAVIVKGKKEFRHHRFLVHAKSPDVFSAELGKGTVFEEHFHTCLVADGQTGQTCSKLVLWDGSTLSLHLSGHGLSLEDYNRRYLINREEETSEKILKIERSKWADKCTFLCKICNKILGGKGKLVDHISGEHNVQVGDDFPALNHVVNFAFHTCQICSNNVLWDADCIRAHLDAEHKVDVDNYAANHLKNYQENENCQPEVIKIESWMNRCRFRCMLCPDKPEVGDKKSLVNHLRSGHIDFGGDYFKTYNNGGDETFCDKVEHVCQECGVTVLWDQGSNTDKLVLQQPSYNNLLMLYDSKLPL